MHLKVVVPFQVIAEVEDVERIVVETNAGSFGLLPHRLDCVAALAPGILTYQAAAHGIEYMAVDAGVMVKAGCEVIISVRRAIAGADLDQLHEAVKREFLTQDEGERGVKAAMIKMETGLIGHLAEFQHER